MNETKNEKIILEEETKLKDCQLLLQKLESLIKKELEDLKQDLKEYQKELEDLKQDFKEYQKELQKLELIKQETEKKLESLIKNEEIKLEDLKQDNNDFDLQEKSVDKKIKDLDKFYEIIISCQDRSHYFVVNKFYRDKEVAEKEFLKFDSITNC